jgi:hypothetical protein
MEQNDKLPAISQDKVVAAINIALTKQQLSVQALQNTADNLEFTPEKREEISQFLAKLNSTDKVTEQTHKDGKAPYLEGGRIWDAGKNSTLAIIEAIRKTVKPKFDQMCAEEDRKKSESARQKQREIDITAGIENNVISFSAKIAVCTTNAELLDIERIINLEKSDSRKDKYGEYHQQAVEKYDKVLKPILKSQKEKIKEKEALEVQIQEAEKNNDAVKLDELNEKKEIIEEEIQQNSVKVQEEALNNAAIDFIPLAEEVFADTKFRRTYTIEVSDEKEAFKKAKDLLDISVNKVKAGIVLQTLKETGVFKDKSEVIVNGIKYSEIKNYK